MKIDSFLKDVGGASRVTKARRMSYKNASAVPQPKDPIRELADLLHPDKMRFCRHGGERCLSPTSKTFRLVSRSTAISRSSSAVSMSISI